MSDDVSPAPSRGRGRRLWTLARVRIVALVGLVVTAFVGAFASGVVGQLFAPTAPVETDNESPVGGGFAVGVSTIYKCGQAFALPALLDPDTQGGELNAVPMTQLLQEHNGAPQGTVTVEMVLTGASQRHTRILDVSVSRLKTAPNLSGTALFTPCEGDDRAISTTIDLDQPPRNLMNGAQPYFDSHDLDVSVDDRETIRVRVSAKERSYRWIFAVRYIDGAGAVAAAYLGTDGRLYGTPDQVPQVAEFSLTGPAAKYDVAYRQSGGRYYLCSTDCPTASR